MKPDEVVRKQLLSFLRERNAHLGFEDLLDDFPLDHVNDNIEGVEYTPWQLLEHIRLTQKDIINFIENPDYKAPKWPEGYWPQGEKGNEAAWQASATQFLEDLSYLEALVENPKTDLYQTMPAGEKYTILREILVVIDHNAHHLGQLILFKKHFLTW